MPLAMARDLILLDFLYCNSNRSIQSSHSAAIDSQPEASGTSSAMEVISPKFDTFATRQRVENAGQLPPFSLYWLSRTWASASLMLILKARLRALVSKLRGSPR